MWHLIRFHLLHQGNRLILGLTIILSLVLMLTWKGFFEWFKKKHDEQEKNNLDIEVTVILLIEDLIPILLFVRVHGKVHSILLGMNPSLKKRKGKSSVICVTER